MASLLSESQRAGTEAAGTTLSSTRLQQRLAVCHRYFTALARQSPPEKNGPSKKTQTNLTNLSKQKRWASPQNLEKILLS